MWRRSLSSHLRSLAAAAASTTSTTTTSLRSVDTLLAAAVATANSSRLGSLFPRSFASESENVVDKPKVRVEDVMPIATGHEREELEAELQGKDILEINHPSGPFGTKVSVLYSTQEAPAVVKSVYDERIVGCPGGEGEDEHDVVWFTLKKDIPYECPVCSQYFVLEVVGPGGSPHGHDDDDDEHHDH
ncbi:Cytochrome c oxidase subunit 5b-2, mitochondrial-like protein [Drosera capensis]